jgi:hypothetical protein
MSSAYVYGVLSENYIIVLVKLSRTDGKQLGAKRFLETDVWGYVYGMQFSSAVNQNSPNGDDVLLIGTSRDSAVVWRYSSNYGVGFVMRFDQMLNHLTTFTKSWIYSSYYTYYNYMHWCGDWSDEYMVCMGSNTYDIYYTTSQSFDLININKKTGEALNGAVIRTYSSNYPYTGMNAYDGAIGSTGYLYACGAHNALSYLSLILYQPSTNTRYQHVWFTPSSPYAYHQECNLSLTPDDYMVLYFPATYSSSYDYKTAVYIVAMTTSTAYSIISRYEIETSQRYGYRSNDLNYSKMKMKMYGDFSSSGGTRKILIAQTVLTPF